MPRTWIEISREALQRNIDGIKNILEPGVVFCAVVKSFAYGHGTREVVTVCLEEGITHFAVDSISEAEEWIVLVSRMLLKFVSQTFSPMFLNALITSLPTFPSSTKRGRKRAVAHSISFSDFLMRFLII